ncbi:Phospholipase A1-IIdelta [Morella rubra]|uniref:Phospholipase A1-IIdelta n=1 Tax=Morella rubra TaxID=262757 RepID=A0A6A1VD89_9ROSI|nr:Phospholipase A1-IIdelta [Morella rubra]
MNSLLGLQVDISKVGRQSSEPFCKGFIGARKEVTCQQNIIICELSIGFTKVRRQAAAINSFFFSSKSSLQLSNDLLVGNSFTRLILLDDLRLYQSSEFLKDKCLVPGSWWVEKNEGLVRNEDGEWIVASPEEEDLPVPEFEY